MKNSDSPEISSVNTHLSKELLEYTGEQLRSHWIRKTFGIGGDTIAAFVGPCNVKSDFMVDLVDLEANSKIYSPSMLHFITEHFSISLENGILRQRLLAAIACEYLRSITNKSITRKGDDLYFDNRKLSVSIASISPVSALIHLGINVKTEGVPVPACGLEELGLEPFSVAQQIMKIYASEIASVLKVRTNVRPVR